MFINRNRVQHRIWIRLDGNVGWRIPVHVYDLIFFWMELEPARLDQGREIVS